MEARYEECQHNKLIVFSDASARSGPAQTVFASLTIGITQ